MDISNTLYKAGTAIAMLLMVAELSYINSKSLLFLIDETQPVDRFFSVVGAVAFSTVTVIVMRRSRQHWMKLVFPAFDGVLVFCGFNLKFANDYGRHLLDNPVAFCLSIAMALFAALIMYGIGTINNDDTGASEKEKSAKLKTLETDNNTLLTEMLSLKTKTKTLESDNKKLRVVYLQAERSRILKKNEANRTAEELEILKESERITNDKWK